MTTPALEIRSVSKSFGALKALQDVTIKVEQGEIFGFLGPNGAGKTTAIRCIMDYYRPDSGTIAIFGKDSRHQGPEARQSVGYLSAENQLYGHWTGRQHINYVLKAHGKKDTAQNLAHRLELDINKKVKALSSGNKQKLAVVLAFCAQPRLVVMDEPTRGLDPLLQIELYQIIQEHAAGGGTVFFSSHNLPEIQRLCNRVAVIRGGEVVATNTLNDLLQLQTHIVAATTKKPIPRQAITAKDIQVIEHDDGHISLKVRGDLEHVLATIMKYGLVDLQVTHANLEDIFMEFYNV